MVASLFPFGLQLACGDEPSQSAKIEELSTLQKMDGLMPQTAHQSLAQGRM